MKTIENYTIRQTLAALVGAAFFWGSFASAQQQFNVPLELQRFEGLENDSLASRKVAREQMRRRNMGEIGGKMVPVGTRGSETPLRNVVKHAFQHHDELRQSIARVPRTAFAQPPVHSEPVVFEGAQEFIVVRETKMLVSDPARLKDLRGMKLFDAGAAPKGSGDDPDKMLTDKQVAQGLERLAKTLGAAPKNHPLKPFANDKRKLLEAIAEGKGEHIITTTLSIPKRHQTRLDFRGALPAKRPTDITRPGDRVVSAPIGARLPQLNAVNTARLPEFVVMRCVRGAKLGEVRVGEFGDEVTGIKVAPAGSTLRRPGDRVVHLERVSDFMQLYRLTLLSGKGYDIASPPNQRLTAAFGPQLPGTFLFIAVPGRRNTYTLHDMENRRPVTVDSEGFLRMASSENSSSASHFELTATTWSPALTVSVGTDLDPGLRFDVRPLNRSVRIPSIPFRFPGGDERTKSLPLRLPYGTKVRVTPTHPERVFNPSSATIELRGSSHQSFAAIPLASGEVSINAPFLAGNTESHNFSWEISVKFPSGRFSAGAGAYFNIGLRAPVRITGTMSPSRIVSEPQTVTVDLKAEAVERHNAEYYRSTGLPERDVHNGHEFVFNAGAYYHLRLRALWKTWLSEGWEKKFDYDKDFRFPLGPNDSTPAVKIEFPPEITQSDFSSYDDIHLGVDCIDAKIILGAQVDIVDGRARCLVTPTSGESRSFTLNPTGEHSFRVNPPSRGSRNFGVKIDLLTYTFNLALSPTVKLTAPVHIGDGWASFKRNFSVGPVVLSDISLRTPNITLKKHDDTNPYTSGRGTASAAP